MSYGSVTPVTEAVLAERVSQDIGAGHMFKPGTAYPGPFGHPRTSLVTGTVSHLINRDRTLILGVVNSREIPP
jgi:hypothetical protein